MSMQTSNQVMPVVRFLKDHMPQGGDGVWHHRFITVCQIVCEALAALGQVEEAQLS